MTLFPAIVARIVDPVEPLPSMTVGTIVAVLPMPERRSCPWGWVSTLFSEFLFIMFFYSGSSETTTIGRGLGNWNNLFDF